MIKITDMTKAKVEDVEVEEAEEAEVVEDVEDVEEPEEAEEAEEAEDEPTVKAKTTLHIESRISVMGPVPTTVVVKCKPEIGRESIFLRSLVDLDTIDWEKVESYPIVLPLRTLSFCLTLNTLIFCSGEERILDELLEFPGCEVVR